MKNGKPGSERVRTSEKAERRLLQMLEEYQPLERIALLHTNAHDKAQALLKRASNLIPKGDVYTMDITPVIGAHLGPGALGYAIISKNPV